MGALGYNALFAIEIALKGNAADVVNENLNEPNSIVSAPPRIRTPHSPMAAMERAVLPTVLLAMRNVCRICRLVPTAGAAGTTATLAARIDERKDIKLGFSG